MRSHPRRYAYLALGAFLVLAAFGSETSHPSRAAAAHAPTTDARPVTAPSSAFVPSTAAGPGHRTWYVSAEAAAGGDGTRRAPFNALLQAQGWSAPGDTIAILPAGRPLDGGITLKPGQTLVGEGPAVTSPAAPADAPTITNTTGFSNGGNAVVLADGTTVRNLVVADAYRSGVYGANVTGVRVTGNDVHGQNTSCGVGIHIFPFRTYASAGLPNGWAGIMIDNTSRSARGRIDGNHVHDAACGDGIDLRLAGTARFDAALSGNKVAGLREGTAHGLRSVLAVGIQTADSSRLSARIDDTTVTGIGSAGADPEGLFANIGGSSTADIRVDRFSADGIRGGFSANGAEFVLMQESARANVKVTDSSFTNVTGDVIEALTFGRGQRLVLDLDNVTAAHAALPSGAAFDRGLQWPFYNTASCLVISNTSPEFEDGGGNTISTTVTNSRMTDCVAGIVDATRRSQRETALTVRGSTVTGNRQANLYIKNSAPVTAAQSTADPALGSPTAGRLGRLAVKVRDTDLGGATEGPAVYAYQVPGTVRSTTIDLGTRHDPGRNDLSGGHGSAELASVPVRADGNWWGRPDGPEPTGLVLTGDASITHEAPLAGPPS
ncbi:right-handed parallel beta-helix repeat-containing protein [Actinomadura sp. NPDC048394]|uniref:right-handed parallel beta-helix repeat-containing protein n=1 Tax=Actinomadura sp. NPDC048394 TaxID=3158223 RepID=UPI0033C2F8DE